MRSKYNNVPARSTWPTLFGVALLLLFGTSHGFAKQSGADRFDLTLISLEELMDIEVTSPGKKAQKLTDVAAAAYVITQEDIRRSGVTSLPEALRLAPGINVARLNSGTWAISSRGFNGRFSDKLLVLIDGRRIYNPLFGGVLWRGQDHVLLDDIDRIEVIRGPGGTLWGENAMNGVINILTKNAEETQGVLLSGGGGTEERGFGSVRYGSAINKDFFYRIYGRYYDRDESFLTEGSHDDVSQGHVGFRADWTMTESDALMLQSNYYDNEAGLNRLIQGQLTGREFMQSGANAGLSWHRDVADDSDIDLKFFYDRQTQEGNNSSSEIDTFSIDFQHRFPLPLDQEIVWGLDYQFTTDELNLSGFGPPVDPEQRDLHFVSLFVQDEIKLIDDRLAFTFGSKFSYNEFTDFEVQPSVRLLWKLTETSALWGAISRAVRIPTRITHDRISTGGFMTEPETLIAYEAGYRLQASAALSLDLAVFSNSYDEIFVTTNSTTVDGWTHGLELSADWEANDRWRLKYQYSYLDMDVDPVLLDGNSPEHQLSIFSYLDITDQIQLDAWIRYVDNLPSLDVPSYTELDLRLGWTPYKNIELSLVGQNLLDSRHLEFFQFPATPTSEVQRGVYGKLDLRF